MRQMFKIFFQAEGTRPWLVLTCLLVGSLAEAIGLGSMLPLISSLTSSSGQPPSAFETAIYRTMEAIGVTPSFGAMVVMILIILFFRSALLFAAMSYASMASARVSIWFRRNLVKAVLDARWSYYGNTSTGQLANHLSVDAFYAGDTYLKFAKSAASAIQVAAYACVALMINWKVALAGVLGGVVIALVSSRLVSISKQTGFKTAKRVSQVTEELVDVLGNIKALKSMQRHLPILSHVDTLIKKLKRALFKQSFARFGLVYGNDFMVALIVAVGAWLAISIGGMSPASLIVTGLIFYQVVANAAKLQKEYQQAVQGTGAHQRISEALLHAKEQQEMHKGTALPDIGKGVSFEDVTFKHEDTHVLKGLSLKIKANAITVIQGPSGAGKTTLLDLLIGLHAPQDGVIKIGDTSLADVDLSKWRSIVGYVPQELALFHDSVTANITLYDETLSQEAVSKAVQLSGVKDFLAQLPNGLDTDVGEFGGKLSGGQRQRISLARALIHSPKLLILDEVTSALDPATEMAIVNNIASLRGHYTIVAITHRPAWTHIADQLYTLKNGKAVLQKTSTKKRK
jgi:ATP-binding cassette, subfamily C, bacterial